MDDQESFQMETHVAIHQSIKVQKVIVKFDNFINLTVYGDSMH